MCVSAAEAIKRQCGWEYGFAEGENRRATDISILHPKNGMDFQRTIVYLWEICLDLTVFLLGAGTENLKQRISGTTWFSINQNK